MEPKGAYQAIADDTRRALLDLLRDEGPLRAGELAEQFPQVSRPAISRHMRVLRGAGLVTVEERGRERWYELDARPLGEIYESWLSRYETYWTERLRALKRLAEED